MALGHGTKIASPRNLVFGYDMNNTTKSWKGAPTTNVINNDSENVPNTLTAYGTTPPTVEKVDIDTPFGTQAWKVTYAAGSNTGYSGCRVEGQSVVAQRDGTQYSYGVWLKSEDLNVIYKYYTGGNGWPSLQFSGIEENGWQWWKYDGHSRTDGGQTSEYLTLFLNSSISSDVVLYVTASQFEQSAVSSPFVNGTRSNTEAILDITGNNSFTIGDLTYNTDGTFEFDGSNDEIETAVNTTEVSFTVSGWVYYNATVSSQQPLVSKWFSGGLSWMVDTVATNTLRFLIRGSPGGDVVCTSTITPNTWINFTATYEDGTGACSLYVNGELADSGTGISSLLVPTNTVQFGRKGDSTSVWLNGKLANVYLFDKVLSSEEVISNFLSLRSRYGV